MAAAPRVFQGLLALILCLLTMPAGVAIAVPVPPGSNQSGPGLQSVTRSSYPVVKVRGAPLPLPYAGSSTQVVTVVAPSAGSQTATITAWEPGPLPGRWKPVIGPVSAMVGELGVGAAWEDVWRTPAGTYTLTQAFGRQPDPGTRLPYFQAGRTDWWDANSKSPTYNTHVVSRTSPGGDSENLYDSGPVYDYAVVIDYNTARLPYRGSGFFLHVTNWQPTWGCVATTEATMVGLLRWLDPAAKPVVVIGVG